jgi:hypothetical protein
MVMSAGKEPNEIVRFLEGTWLTKDITVKPRDETKISEYVERMNVKNHETITITAVGVNGLKKITRDIAFKMNGSQVTMMQRDFSAKGIMNNNIIILQGDYREHSFTFRLYLMDDKYVFQKDVLKDGRIIESQMSYLIRRQK